MTTNELWETKDSCCGCELCSKACPKSVIEMKSDEEGFLYPHVVKGENCISCSRCIKVCPMKSPGRSSNAIIKGYGGYANDFDEVRTSASGGFATQIAKPFISQYNGAVYGVRYSDDFLRAEYSRIEKLENLHLYKGSKYVQAAKGSVYQQVLMDLKNGNKVLFVGLPCEISALYHFLNDTSRLYTVALICHGPTSNYIQRDFVKRLHQHNKTAVTSFSVRHKKTGWKPYYIHASFEDGRQYLKQFDFSDYGIAFQYLKRPSCSVCQYKAGNDMFGTLADITIGDFHAVERGTAKYNKWGVSQACSHTEKGEELLSLLGESCTLYEVPINDIVKTNKAFYAPIPQKKERGQFSEVFVSRGLHEACIQRGIYVPYMKGRLKKRIKGYIVKFKDLLIKR